MAEGDAESLRIPMMDRHRFWVGAISAILFGWVVVELLPAATAGNPVQRALAFALLVLPPAVIAILLILDLIRFRRTVLVLDQEGIWLEGRERRGLLWNNVEGYELPTRRGAPALRVFGRNGSELAVSNGIWVRVDVRDGLLLRELDRRIGPDGHRPVFPVRDGELDRRLLHHYGKIPTLEMEPQVRYRYIQPEVLAGELRSRIGIMATILLSIVFCGTIVSSLQAYLAILVAASPVILWTIAVDVALIRSLQDRFVRRSEGLCRVRNGRETLLPQETKESRLPLGRQPILVVGRGPFAYRMAPQLLEPDV